MKFETRLNYADVKRQAREVQDACNPIAVCNFLTEAMKAVNNESAGSRRFAVILLKAIIGNLRSIPHLTRRQSL
jgi:hypothetical protein